MEIRPGLHRVQAPLEERFVALYLLVGDDAALLVDTGVPASITETLLPYLDESGIGREKLKWAVNTHCDWDHTGGNRALKEALPHVQIMAGEADVPLVENVSALIDSRYGEFIETDGFVDPPELTSWILEVAQLVPVDRPLAGGEEFDLGGRSVTVLHVPGHSPGHVAVHDPENRALMIGDATLGATVPFADGSPAFPPTYRDTADYVASIQAFRALDAELLLTAHYPVYEGEGVAAFLDESEAYTARVDDVMERMLRAQAAPSTTLELIRAAGDALGPWPPEALDYSIFPVTGNLERMEERGLAASATDADGRRRWTWTGDAA
ncbi:hypothetical protein ARHIZOSPH14_20040 [Agromyces rhizosphaerae]|uniref:Metallo-beta-lactamase domain-containing protein n=1 Tax=Agromyces rhizosphaerae TaxID=88374 RepID=A0A9W6CWD6_9MICO|nr:MBL fold metallo-hydrolase [Agromyces rhizosphaerae]GLI27762.1 hypothetical protein ARHIZOSPH14_20040 [Agromyces rhizosphaerae]